MEEKKMNAEISNLIDKKMMSRLKAVYKDAGYLYIVRRQNWPIDHYKLGETDDIMRRLNNYNGSDFFPIECVSLFVCTDSGASEAKIRKQVEDGDLSSKKGSKEFVHIKLKDLISLFQQFIHLDSQLSSLFLKPVWRGGKPPLSPPLADVGNKDIDNNSVVNKDIDNNSVVNNTGTLTLKYCVLKIDSKEQEILKQGVLKGGADPLKFTFFVPEEKDQKFEEKVYKFSEQVNFRLDKLPPKKEKLPPKKENKEKEQKKSFSELLSQWPSSSATIDAAKLDFLSKSSKNGKARTFTTLGKPCPGVNHDSINDRWVGIKDGKRRCFSVKKWGGETARTKAANYVCGI
jgi:hypothetical protein